MPPDTSRLVSSLNTTKTQTTNNALYQTILQLINIVQSQKGQIDDLTARVVKLENP